MTNALLEYPNTQPVKTTAARLRAIGIVKESTDRNPHRYWCQVIEDYLTILPSDTMDIVICKIYDFAYKQGLYWGAQEKAKAIRKELFI